MQRSKSAFTRVFDALWRCSAEPGPTAWYYDLSAGKLGVHDAIWVTCCMASGVRVAMDAAFFVYILASKPTGTLYVGVTNNLARRLSEHKAKLVPGFTRQYGIDQLVYFESFNSILEARARELSLKRWRRAWKVALIAKLNLDWRDLTHELNY